MRNQYVTEMYNFSYFVDSNRMKMFFFLNKRDGRQLPITFSSVVK